MPHKKLDMITREEFDRRLDAYNERMQLEVQQKETELAQLEQLLTYYEQALDEVEARLNAKPEAEEPFSYPALLRKRLQELAIKTTEMAASL